MPSTIASSIFTLLPPCPMLPRKRRKWKGEEKGEKTLNIYIYGKDLCGEKNDRSSQKPIKRLQVEEVKWKDNFKNIS